MEWVALLSKVFNIADTDPNIVSALFDFSTSYQYKVNIVSS